MKHAVTFGYAIAAILLIFNAAQPMSAQSDSTNAQREVSQADGTPVKLHVYGDANERWYTDAQGFTVIEVPNRYVYALRDGKGRLVPTGLLVGQVDPKECGLQKGILPSPEVMAEIRREVLPDGQNVRPRPPGVVQASPHPVEVTQPDGSRIKLHFKGDAKFHWYEDDKGYTVINIAASYEYALRDAQGKLAATGLLAGKDNPKQCGLQQGVLPNR